MTESMILLIKIPKTEGVVHEVKKFKTEIMGLGVW